MLARYGSLAAFLLLVIAVSFLSSHFEAGAWYYEKLVRPGWTPPGWLFGAAWAVTLLLLALAGWQVWLSRHYARLGALTWWLLLLALNVAWSALFFGLNRIGWAWLVMGVAIVIAIFCIRAFRPLSGQGAGLVVPYLAWIGFVWVLNLTMWTMNGGLFSRVLL